MITNQEFFAQYMSDIQAEAGAEEDFCEVTFTEEMCDFNGHMNVNFIKEVFEQGWEFTNQEFGFNDEYLESGFSSFTLEDNYRFKKNFY